MDVNEISSPARARQREQRLLPACVSGDARLFSVGLDFFFSLPAGAIKQQNASRAARPLRHGCFPAKRSVSVGVSNPSLTPGRHRISSGKRQPVDVTQFFFNKSLAASLEFSSPTFIRSNEIHAVKGVRSCGCGSSGRRIMNKRMGHSCFY